MKNLYFKILLPILGISFFASCAFHSGYMVNSASLSSNNFTYVEKDITGSAIATYVLGLGGNDRMALVNEAKNNLLADYPLKSNQALVNLTVNWKNSFVLPLVITTRCTITADIVEFR